MTGSGGVCGGIGEYDMPLPKLLLLLFVILILPLLPALLEAASEGERGIFDLDLFFLEFFSLFCFGGGNSGGVAVVFVLLLLVLCKSGCCCCCRCKSVVVVAICGLIFDSSGNS